jgi:hypothetical protein
VSHVCADKDEIDVRTKDLAHTNPVGGWNGVKDDAGVPRGDSGAGGKPGNPDGTGGNSGTSGTGGGPGIGPDASTIDAAAPCTGTGLAKFHPSNLQDLVVPAGLVPLGDTYCTFITDSSEPNDATITTPHWRGCSVPPTTPLRVITLKDGREAAVLFAESFALSTGRALSVTGQRPLIIMTTGKIDINGTITAYAAPANGWAAGGAVAPSAGRSGACPIDTILGGGRSGSTTSSAGIGPGGGAFCGIGGPGSFDPAGAPAPLGGVAYGTPDLIPLVGGSAGGTSTTAAVIEEGRGGGAIQLVAGTEIIIGDSGIINMGGGGGAYGAGGGSGGAILLEAPTVTVKGVLTANGGSGGSNSSRGQVSQPTDQAALGGGKGGKGAAGGTANGSAGNEGGGASLALAAGGGGVGRIRINTGCGGEPAIAGTAIISPFESTGCFTKGSLQ